MENKKVKVSRRKTRQIDFINPDTGKVRTIQIQKRTITTTIQIPPGAILRLPPLSKAKPSKEKKAK